MNRRDFFKGLGAFMILAPATTYTRVWRATHVIEPAGWTDEDLIRYHNLPFYLAKVQLERDRIVIANGWKHFFDAPLNTPTLWL